MTSIPPREVLEQWGPAVLVVILGAVRVGQVLPFDVTSWYRDPVHNRNVGGAPNSQHLIAAAIDVVPRPGVAVEELANAFVSLGYTAVVEPDHLHVQVWPRSPLGSAA